MFQILENPGKILKFGHSEKVGTLHLVPGLLTPASGRGWSGFSARGTVLAQVLTLDLVVLLGGGTLRSIFVLTPRIAKLLAMLQDSGAAARQLLLLCTQGWEALRTSKVRELSPVSLCGKGASP